MSTDADTGREQAGRRVLVTGGTRGIGRAIVLAFARAGATVYTCGRTETEAAATLRKELADLPGEHVVDAADFADASQCRALVARAAEALGGIDVLVHNVGIVSHRTLAQLDGDEWDRVLNVNLRSVYEVTREALPALADGGSIVIVSSAVATVGMVARTHYTASKAALVGFNRSLCREVGARGIRSNIVAPGVIDTDQAARLTPDKRRKYSEMAALGRLGTPEDIAGVTLFLAGDGARFVTGQTIVVDGGI